jgi:phosphatidylcholine synthase
MSVFSAWLIHFYTASGAVVAFLGVIAVLNERYREAFLWMVVATLIDATDGWLARRLAVRERVPGIDGARLDDIVDYLTFVFLPVLLLYRAGTLPAAWGVGVAAIVLLSSAYGFAAVDAKTDDHFFTGFPSYWNIVALYVFASGLSPAVNAVVLMILSGLVFWRLRYVYPTRTPTLRPLTIGLGAVWSVMVVAIILMLPKVPGLLLLTSLFFPVYYTALSLALNVAQRSHDGRRQPA